MPAAEVYFRESLVSTKRPMRTGGWPAWLAVSKGMREQAARFRAGLVGLPT